MRSVLGLGVAIATTASAQSQGSVGLRSGLLQQRLQVVLDSIRTAGRFPGATVGVALPDGQVLGVATGFADTARKEHLTPDDLMLAGSVGKTFFAALALDLVGKGRLDLDAPISRYLGSEPWFSRLPNAQDITVRMLMTHTSGLVRYEFKEQFTSDLTAHPDKVWRPEELVAYILDMPAPFPAGQGWDYSDTNYIVLAMILERLTGTAAYDEITRRFLTPLGLQHTRPSTGRAITGLIQGYAGLPNPFGGRDAMLKDGRLAISPQFEWAGGGYATTVLDLARWAAALYQGRVIDSTLIRRAVDAAVPARLGPEVRYGLGVIVWPGKDGPVWGHSGFFPGYLTEMRYFTGGHFAIALQINTSVFELLGGSPGAMVKALAAVVREALSH